MEGGFWEIKQQKCLPTPQKGSRTLFYPREQQKTKGKTQSEQEKGQGFQRNRQGNPPAKWTPKTAPDTAQDYPQVCHQGKGTRRVSTAWK